jgi:hypothetical protein
MNGFRIKPLYYFRFLDDIFFIWPDTIETFKEYEKYLNSLIPNIKVNLEYNMDEINFLDTTVYKKKLEQNTTLQTKVYFKPTDTHQLLHHNSHHPKHTFNGIIKSQLIRFKRISSCKYDFDNTCKILFTFIRKRGYSWSNFRTQMKKIWFEYIERVPADNLLPSTNQTEKNDKQQLIPIVLNYSQFGMNLATKYKQTLNTDNFFSKFKIVKAFRNSKTLKQHLVKSRLDSGKVLTNQSKGKFAVCGQRNCKTCKIHALDCNKIHSTTHNKDFFLNHSISCNSSNLVYLITCQRCYMQYVGETSRTLRDRLNDHRSAIKLHKNTPIGVHFNDGNHSVLDLKIVGIELVTPGNNSNGMRKIREKAWQKQLGTVHPLGLNGMIIDD